MTTSPADSRATHGTHPGAAAPTTAAPGHVLVVDDEPDFQTLFGHYLRKMGHTVSYASDGLAAWALIQDTAYDLVILDLRLPRMDGMALLQAVRGDPALAGLPIIVVTAHADQDTAVRCLQGGADEFLEKPIRPVVLTVRVNSVLLRHQQARRQQEYIASLQAERDRGDALLRELLPDPIARELMETRAVRPRRHSAVAVLFADVANFTAFSERVDPVGLHATLQEMVCAFESIGAAHGIEKIKTIGDCFMGVAGLLDFCESPVARCVEAGLAMVRTTRALRADWALRAGIDFGPVSAGIIGRHRYSYDVWGDTVNTAERVQHCAAPNRVCLSTRAWLEVSELVEGQWEGPVPAHGKPSLRIFRVDGLKEPSTPEPPE